MPKYRKKPVVIEAFQMTKEARWDNKDWPNWLNKAWNETKGWPGAFWCDVEDEDLLQIATLEGNHTVSYNDFIIQGVKGEIYPCKPDIFDATYELVEE